MVYAQHEDDSGFFVDFVDDSVRPPPCGPQAGQLVTQRVSGTSRRFAEVAEHELDNSGR